MYYCVTEFEHFNDTFCPDCSPDQRKTHQGEIHSCAVGEMDCWAHYCDGLAALGQDPSLIRQQLDELESLLPSLDRATLRRIELDYPGFQLNRDRNAMQLLSCGDRVVLSVPFASVQLTDAEV